MSEEIQEAVQIIRVAYDGIEIAMKVGSGGFAAMQKAFEVLTAMLDYEKSIGKISMRKLLMKGGDLQVFQFKTDEMKRVEKMLKKYGILYSVLPDINKKDGMSEIIFHTEAVPRMNMLIQKINHGKIATFEDYLKNGNEQEIEKLVGFLNEQKRHPDGSSVIEHVVDSLLEKVGMYVAEKKDISIEHVKNEFGLEHQKAEDILKRLEIIGMLGKKNENGIHEVLMDKEAFGKRIRKYHDLAERMRAMEKSKNPNLVDITVSKKLIVKENKTAIKTRIPGRWGQEGSYIWLDKEKVQEIHNGKTLLTSIDISKEYKLYNEEDRVIKTISGVDLYDHYDEVEERVRQRYEQAKKRATERKARKRKTVRKTVKKENVQRR